MEIKPLRSRFGLPRTILDGPPDVQEGKTDLQKDECVSAVMQSPNDPQRIAQDE